MADVAVRDVAAADAPADVGAADVAGPILDGPVVDASGPDVGAPDASVPDASAPDAGVAHVLTVTPSTVTARQHLGGAGELPLIYEFTVPTTLQGAGLPTKTSVPPGDLAVAEIELPQSIHGSTDETSASANSSILFDGPVLCLLADAACWTAAGDGLWTGTVVHADGSSSPVQIGMAVRDQVTNKPYDHAFGVFLPAGSSLEAGDRLRLSYRGVAPARSTDWTGMPLVANFRYRTFDSASPPAPGPWTTLSDDQVQGLDVGAAALAKYVRALAPLDVQVGEPFTVAVVVTDHYGNPRPITGSVTLSDSVSAELQFNDEWRKEVPGVMYPAEGAYRIVPHLDGARSVYHYTVATAGPPSVRRLVGDTHIHSGDGGAGRKFLGASNAGDHDGLFTRTHTALRYLHEVAGLDFASMSEHAMRWDSYAPPAGVAADPAFQAGGACAGAGSPLVGLGDWFTRQQAIVHDFSDETGGAFVTFPAFEWHGALPPTNTPLHRVVMFRDFSPDPVGAPLPILPGDVSGLPPQCVVRFLDDAGFSPEKALVIPHMMQAQDLNVDWDLTYQDSSVAPRARTDAYYRVGEIYSARAIGTGAPGKATLTAFDGADQDPRVFTYRYAWRKYAPHLGVIGSSDNHMEMPGANDDLDLEGASYHANEPGGYAVVLAASAGRDGIFDALETRATYATSGVRAWLDFRIGGAQMGTAGLGGATAPVEASITLLAGMQVARVELWAARAGDAATPYQLVRADAPDSETYQATVPIASPLAPGDAPQEWLYYVRAFLSTSGSPYDADEAVWSSPIWITWS